nr:NUDIX domain-containing protein [Peribacillus kribbensis]
MRNSAKAVILKEDQLLLTKNQDEQGVFYLFPGGGQEHGETLLDAVKRECIEEIGMEVEPGEFCFLREYIGKNHEFASFDSGVHAVEFYFSCSLKGELKGDDIPSSPDSDQIGIEWVRVMELENVRMYPKGIVTSLKKYVEGRKPSIYLGDIN